jgi:hypothetical protein
VPAEDGHHVIGQGDRAVNPLVYRLRSNCPPNEGHEVLGHSAVGVSGLKGPGVNFVTTKMRQSSLQPERDGGLVQPRRGPLGVRHDRSARTCAVTLVV